MAISGVKLCKNDILDAIRENKGIIAHVAEALGCKRETIYTHMENDIEIKEAVTLARLKADRDFIEENQILKAKAYKSAQHLLDKRDCTMTIFTLKSLAGWKEAVQEHNITLNHIEKPYRDDKSE